LDFELAAKNDRVAALEAEVVWLEKKRKRKAIPNPNKRFMLMGEAIAAGGPNVENPDLNNEPIVKEEGEEEVNDGIDEDDEDDEIEAPIRYTRSSRSIKPGIQIGRICRVTAHPIRLVGTAQKPRPLRIAVISLSTGADLITSSIRGCRITGGPLRMNGPLIIS
jgi:hypothetical protein